MGFLAIPPLPNCSTDPKYGPCPPARDWGSRVSGHVFLFHTLVPSRGPRDPSACGTLVIVSPSRHDSSHPRFAPQGLRPHLFYYHLGAQDRYDLLSSSVPWFGSLTTRRWHFRMFLPWFRWSVSGKMDIGLKEGANNYIILKHITYFLHISLK